VHSGCRRKPTLPWSLAQSIYLITRAPQPGWWPFMLVLQLPLLDNSLSKPALFWRWNEASLIFPREQQVNTQIGLGNLQSMLILTIKKRVLTTLLPGQWIPCGQPSAFFRCKMSCSVRSNPMWDDMTLCVSPDVEVRAIQKKQIQISNMSQEEGIAVLPWYSQPATRLSDASGLADDIRWQIKSLSSCKEGQTF
jgi:hypothetical protein